MATPGCSSILEGIINTLLNLSRTIRNIYIFGVTKMNRMNRMSKMSKKAACQ